jgi:tetratricopeptide (TPR) repeat protein
VRELLSGPERTLLVLDNLETVDDEHIFAFLRDLPQPAKAIVTSRHRIDVAYSVRLHGLPPDEAADLISSEMSERDLTLTGAEIDALVRKTGGVPLAILWSLGLMTLGHPAASVLRRLGSGHSDIAAFCFAESAKALEGTDAVRVLNAAALFDAPVERSLLGEAAGLGEDAIARDDAIQTLIQLSLINLRDGGFTLLPLTRTYVLQMQADQPEVQAATYEAWFSAILGIAAEYHLHDPSWRDIGRLRTVGPHIETAFSSAREHKKLSQLISLAGAILSYLDCTGRWDDLLATCEELEGYGRVRGDTDLVINCAWYQNWIHGQRGDFEAAWSALDRVRSLPATAEDTVRHLVNCSQTSRRQQSFVKAHQFVAEARALVPALSGPLSPSLRAHLSFEEGKLARDTGDLASAERLFRETSSVFDPEAAAQAIASGENPEYDLEWAVRVLSNLGLVEHRRGDLAGAALLLERALAYTRQYGSASNLATLLVRLLDVQIDLGQLDQATETLAEAESLATRLRMRDEFSECRRLAAKAGISAT